MMKKLENFCIDCGSKAVSTTVDEVKRVHKLMVVTYECGAVLRSSFSAMATASCRIRDARPTM